MKPDITFAVNMVSLNIPDKYVNHGIYIVIRVLTGDSNNTPKIIIIITIYLS